MLFWIYGGIKMHSRIIRSFKNGLIVLFLILLTAVSFEREKTIAQSEREYMDEDFNAEIVSHTTPEKAERARNYQIHITVKNCGEIVWSDEDNIALCIWQEDIDWGFRAHILEGVQIQKGEYYTFVLDGFSMADKAKTKLEFQMVKEGVTYFGEREAVEIVTVE